MASVLKQDSISSGPSKAVPVAFNIEDMQARAREYFQEMQNQAAELIAQAKQEAVKIKNQARLEGLQAAQAENQKKIEETAAKLSDQRCRTAIESCEKVVQRLNESTSEWLSDWRNQTVTVAARIAEKIVRAHLRDNSELLRVWMEEAIVAMRDERDLRISVNPDDFSVAGRFLQSLSRSLPHAGGAEVVPDPDVKPGGCVVRSKNGQIDQQIETQLQRLIDQLGS
ncbi:MAG: FliH/SctL family protein [Pirellulales bacterium]